MVCRILPKAFAKCNETIIFWAEQRVWRIKMDLKENLVTRVSVKLVGNVERT